MTALEIASLLAWPIAYAVTVLGRRMDVKRLESDVTWYRRATEDAYRLVEAQQVAIRETRRDNIEAFNVVASAASRLVESGSSPDELIGWLRASQAMSQNHQDTARNLCAQNGARR